MHQKSWGSKDVPINIKSVDIKSKNIRNIKKNNKFCFVFPPDWLWFTHETDSSGKKIGSTCKVYSFLYSFYKHRHSWNDLSKCFQQMNLVSGIVSVLLHHHCFRLTQTSIFQFYQTLLLQGVSHVAYSRFATPNWMQYLPGSCNIFSSELFILRNLQGWNSYETTTYSFLEIYYTAIRSSYISIQDINILPQRFIGYCL